MQIPFALVAYSISLSSSSLPAATSRGACALRSSLTPSRKPRPPAFSRAFPERSANQLSDAYQASERKSGLCSPTPSLRSMSALVGLMMASTLMAPILLTSLSVSESCRGGDTGHVTCDSTSC